jgi:hypothetical protein
MWVGHTFKIATTDDVVPVVEMPRETKKAG